jgi:leucyl aminopeptidase
MKLHLFNEQQTEYSAHILPLSGNVLPAEYLAAFPELESFPLPENEEWTVAMVGDKRLLLLSFDPKSHQKKICDTFRLFAVKAQKYLGSTPLIYTETLGKRLEPALRGMVLSTYILGHYKEENRQQKDKIIQQVWVKATDENTLVEAKLRAEVQMRAMHLVDLPPCDKTPAMLGDWATESAKSYGFECEVWNAQTIVNLGLHALNAVGKGSQYPPVFIISRYRGKADSTEVDIALVGKGVTFDTGGISIKPSDNLHYMKCDMAGGAAMLGAIELAARLKLPLNITAVVPAAENAVDAKSVLPGDVIHSYSGKTIEIINTDAEGRLILADALTWTVRNEKPKCIIDMATLTGAAVRALGKEAASLYSEDDVLSNAIMKAGYLSGEKLWPMPLWSDYNSYLHSDVADVSNLPQSPTAGSIAAAKFLQVFTEHHPSWAHIDMPGSSFVDSPFAKMKSASGYGVQLIFELMRALP